jgi:hypothetical protein
MDRPQQQVVVSGMIVHEKKGGAVAAPHRPPRLANHGSKRRAEDQPDAARTT